MHNTKPLIVTFSGLTGSGKTAVSKRVFEMLKERGKSVHLIAPTFKDIAKSKNMTEVEFQKFAEKNGSIDKEFDLATISSIRHVIHNADVILLASWLAPFLAQIVVDEEEKGSLFSVWLETPLSTRAERTASRENLSLEDAIKYIRNKEGENNVRYERVYGLVNIATILRNFAHLYIDTSNFDIDGVARVIVCGIDSINKGFIRSYAETDIKEERYERFLSAVNMLKNVLDEYRGVKSEV